MFLYTHMGLELDPSLIANTLARWCIQNPDSKVHGANIGPIWGRQYPGGPHVGPMNLAIWEGFIRYHW